LTQYGLCVLGGPSAPEAAALDDLRPEWIRARVFWSPAIQGWGWADAVVADAERRGAKMLLEWWYWAKAKGAGDVSDVPVATHAAHAGEMAARYRGRVAAYQIDNEPDAARVSAATYAKRYNAVRAAIRKADPAAVVVPAGLAMHPVNTSWLGAFLRAVTPDVVAVHSYPELDSTMMKLNAVRRAARGRQVWLTETGGRTWAKTREAIRTSRGADMVFVYAAADDNAAPWGLYDAAGQPKDTAELWGLTCVRA